MKKFFIVFFLWMFSTINAQSVSWIASNGKVRIRLTATAPNCSNGSVRLTGTTLAACGNGKQPTCRITRNGVQVYQGDCDFNRTFAQGTYSIEPGINCGFPASGRVFTMQYNIDWGLASNSTTICNNVTSVNIVKTGGNNAFSGGGGNIAASGYNPVWSIQSGGAGATIAQAGSPVGTTLNVNNLPVGNTVIRFAMRKTNCEDINEEFYTITRVGPVTTGAIKGDQILCGSGTPTALTSVTNGTGTGTITYKWEKSTDGTTWTTVSGATGASYTPPTTTVSTYYRRTTIATLNSVACPSTTATNTVLVKVLPVSAAAATIVSDKTAVCVQPSGAPINITFSGTNGTAPYTFNYTKDGVDQSLVTTGTDTSATISQPISTPGTYTYTLTSLVDSSGGCSKNFSPSNLSVIVKPLYINGASGVGLPSLHGITSLGRAGTDSDNWPMVRQSAWTVLEAKTKGFVVNRVKFNTSNQPVADNGTTLVITNPVEGMMVYDTTNNCLKVYTTTDGTTFAWHCMSTQTCPQ